MLKQTERQAWEEAANSRKRRVSIHTGSEDSYDSKVEDGNPSHKELGK